MRANAPRAPASEGPAAVRPRGLRGCVLVLAAGLLASACEPRLPLSYMRDLARPTDMTFALGAPPDTAPPSVTEALPPPIPRGWDAIVARDTLKALLTFNSTSYFIHRGEPLGFEYDLLKTFADVHDLELDVVVVRNRRDLFRKLNAGEGDVVAARLVADPQYQEVVALTEPLYTTRPVMVQRTGPPPEDTAPAEPDTVTADGFPRPVSLRARLLRRPSELAGEEIHLPAGSDYYDRILELSDSLGESIELVEVENADQVEPLIQAVSEGRIRLTVSPENLADLTRARFSNITATPVVGPVRPTVWAVRENAPELKARLDAFLRSDTAQSLRPILYTKYFVDRQAYRDRVEDEMLAHESGRISPYDSLLESQARQLGWDWRLLAAQVAQESRFDPLARSWAGATGLLQLMPRTAREMGVSDPTDPAQSVAGGVRYLLWLSDLWEEEIPDPEERRKFILASYNVGRGHVLDAQRLAEKYGDDPTSWEDVAYWLLQKSKGEVYRDPVVQHGYARGLEPVQYVSRILERYDRYRGVE